MSAQTERLSHDDLLWLRWVFDRHLRVDADIARAEDVMRRLVCPRCQRCGGLLSLVRGHYPHDVLRCPNCEFARPALPSSVEGAER